MTMMYDLFFAFLQTGRYREARKIIEVSTHMDKDAVIITKLTNLTFLFFDSAILCFSRGKWV